MMLRLQPRTPARFAVLAVLGLASCAPSSGSNPSGTETLVFAAGSSDVVISQIYGGGGNSGAPLNHDYVELFNRGASSVTVDGWSVQYASATGTTTPQYLLFHFTTQTF